MKKSSYCYTTSSNHLCKQSPHPSTAFQTSMSSFIYHILLSLTDLSLIYSCRLHVEFICHATRSINLHTDCIPRDREICLPSMLRDRGTCLSATQLIHPRTSCMLRDGGTCVPTGHSIGQPTYQLHAPRWGICLPAAYSAIRQSVY